MNSSHCCSDSPAIDQGHFRSTAHRGPLDKLFSNHHSSTIMSNINMSKTHELQDETEIIVDGENLHKTYLFGLEGVAALRGVSLKIKQGEFVMILGNSGGGKTSLLNLIGTIDKKTKGNLKVYGDTIKENTSDSTLSCLRLNHLGFVFQSFNLIGALTAKQNVELPMILKGDLSTSEVSLRAQQLLQSVGMSHRLKHFPRQLSGGEQQRVTIARALANKPSMLLLDQPTGDLDSRNSHIVLDILLTLNIEENITLVMVTHDVSLKFYSHRVLKVLDGKIIGQELIDPNIRSQNIKNLKAKIEQHQDELQINQAKLDYRKAEQYGAIRWLREKQIRDRVNTEMIEKVKGELIKLSLAPAKFESSSVGLM